MGNPPYAAASSNKGNWIMNLMDPYKREPGGADKLKERNPKWLNDDYVKFIRFCENFADASPKKIIAFINPHGFIDNPTFRGMRWHLLQSFDKIFIVDLHGNSNRKEKSPDGSKDDNVFDIQQGVSINIFVRSHGTRGSQSEVYHADLWGSREKKYQELLSKELKEINFKKVNIVEPEYNFTPTNLDAKNKYSKGFSIDSLFINYSVGVVTAKDKILIGASIEELYKQVKDYYKIEPDRKKIHRINYRPFDQRYIYYDPQLLERSREGIMKAFFGTSNIGLITARSNKGDDCSQFLITDIMSEAKCGERTTQSAVFPLYMFEEHFGKYKKVLNINKEIIEEISKQLGIPFNNDNMSSEKEFSGEELLSYIYAVLYLKQYREKYKQFLNSAFPRIPYPSDVKVFKQLVRYGQELIHVHLMHSLEARVDGDEDLIGRTIERVTYKNGCIFIDKKSCFTNVSEETWKYTMCGYQPMQKWMKDRKGKVIQDQDIVQLRRIQTAVDMTIDITNRMDSDPIATSIIP